MKLIGKVLAILLLVSVAGCGKDDKPVKTAETVLLNKQLETLEQAKQVEQGVQDAADQQRQKIEQGTQ